MPGLSTRTTRITNTILTNNAMSLVDNLVEKVVPRPGPCELRADVLREWFHLLYQLLPTACRDLLEDSLMKNNIDGKYIYRGTKED